MTFKWTPGVKGFKKEFMQEIIFLGKTCRSMRFDCDTFFKKGNYSLKVYCRQYISINKLRYCKAMSNLCNMQQTNFFSQPTSTCWHYFLGINQVCSRQHYRGISFIVIYSMVPRYVCR